MFNVYDKYSLVFDNGDKSIVFEFMGELRDFDDYIIIETPVPIGDIKRGWLGDITFNLSGFDAERGFGEEDRVKESFTLKDMLCSARTLEVADRFSPMWRYKFNKY